MADDYIEVFRVVDNHDHTGEVWYTSPDAALEHDRCGAVMLHGTARRSDVLNVFTDRSCVRPGQVLVLWRQNLVSP